MWTLEMLNAVPKHTIFATGVLPDTADGLFMANTGKELRFVAVSGEIGDFCIYCHFADKDVEWIRHNGDKVCVERHIKRCVPMDDEVFARYRY